MYVCIYVCGVVCQFPLPVVYSACQQFCMSVEASCVGPRAALIRLCHNFGSSVSIVQVVVLALRLARGTAVRVAPALHKSTRPPRTVWKPGEKGR